MTDRWDGRPRTTHPHVGKAFGVHLAVITRPWARFNIMAQQSGGILVAEKGYILQLKLNTIFIRPF